MISRLRTEVNFLDLIYSLLPIKNAKEKFINKLKEEFNTDILLMPSGRAALYYLFKALPQKTIILPAFTCSAVIEAANLTKKNIKYIDISLDNYNLDINQLKKEIEKNSIIVATHQFGIPFEIDEIEPLIKKNKCILIEDNAGGYGAKYKNKKTGFFGEASILSFDYTKTISCARGGAIIFHNHELYKKVKDLYEKEIKKPKFKTLLNYLFTNFLYFIITKPFIYKFFLHLFIKYRGIYSDKGDNLPLKKSLYEEDFSNIQAKLGLRHLKRRNYNLKRRKEIMEKYIVNLSNLNNIKLFKFPTNSEPLLIRFPIRILNEDKISFYKKVLKKGLDLGFSFSYYYGDKPNAKIISKQVLNLPINSKLSDKEVNKIIEIIKSID